MKTLKHLACTVTAAFTLASCGVTAYDVDLSGSDLSRLDDSPVVRVEADKVTPVVSVDLPNEIGGATVDVPVEVKVSE